MSSIEDLRTSLMEPHQEYVEKAIEEKRRSGVTNAESSQASVAALLQAFDRELEKLYCHDREALLAVFRKELTMLIFQFRIASIPMQFMPPSIRR